MQQKHNFVLALLSMVIMSSFFFFGDLHNADAIEYEFLGAKPAFPDPDVEHSESWFIYNLKPGEAIEDGVIAMNLFKEDLDVLIYAADSTPSSSGGFAFRQYVEPKEHVGSWLKFYPDEPPTWFSSIFDTLDEKIIRSCELSKNEVDELSNAAVNDEQYGELQKWCEGTDSIETNLKSEERRFIPFVFSVPDDPSLDVGEHTGAIAIQKKAPSVQNNGDQSAVRLTMRLGVRIYQTVPGDIIKDLSLDSVKVDKNYKEFDYTSWFKKDTKPESFIFSVEAVNTESNVSVLFTEKTFIEKLFPQGETEESERTFQVLRGDTFISNFLWENPRFGKFRFTKEINYENTDGEDVVLNTDPITIWIMPWREIVAVLVLLLFVAIGAIYWRIRTKKLYGGIGWETYIVQEGDNIHNLSEAYEVDWKVLAKTNRLQPPYKLEVGQQILLPPGGSQDGRPTYGMQNTEPMDGMPGAQSGGYATTQTPAYKKKTLWIIAFAVVLCIVLSILFVSRDKKTVTLEADISTPKMTSTASDPEVQEEMQREDAVEEDVSNTIEISEEDLYEYKVQVLNGGAPDGSAGSTAGALEDRGFTAVDAANAEQERSGNTLYYKAGGEDIAQKLGDILDQVDIQDVTLEEDTEIVEQQNAVFVLFLGS